MIRVALSPEAQADSDAIITNLARDAGLAVARGCAGRFDAAYRPLADHPDIGPIRPRLGIGIRVKVVTPHVSIYDHNGAQASVTVLRILHGKRRITRRLLP